VKQLVLLRHAEAEPAGPGTRDFDRILTERGRSQALEAADVIAAAQLTVDECLVSPARRTRDTASIVIRKLAVVVPTEFVTTLYLAAPDAMLQALQGCRTKSDCVLLIGHNPGMSELASTLSRSTQGLTLRTGGVCQLTFAHNAWDQLAAQCASACRVLR
jgi:phosphohistidine phosphatase